MCYCGSRDSVVRGVCWKHQLAEWEYHEYLEEQQGYTPGEVYAELHRWGREQRSRYVHQMELFDEQQFIDSEAVGEPE